MSQTGNFELTEYICAQITKEYLKREMSSFLYML